MNANPDFARLVRQMVASEPWKVLEAAITQEVDGLTAQVMNDPTSNVVSENFLKGKARGLLSVLEWAKEAQEPRP